MKLAKSITNTLEYQNFRILSVGEQNGDYIAELETFSPEGEDVIVDIWFDGTSRNFIDKFWNYATGFDADEHAEFWVDYRGKGGCPSSIRALIEDADAIKRILTETGEKLNRLRGRMKK